MLLVAPFAGAWIETCNRVGFRDCGASRPSRARGLKQAVFGLSLMHWMSRPSRARGLKRDKLRCEYAPYVAPFAGAWIETSHNKG